MQILCSLRQTVCLYPVFCIHNLLQLREEPRVIFGDAVDFLVAHAEAQRLTNDEQTIRRGDGQTTAHTIARILAFHRNRIEPRQAGLERTQRLLQRLAEIAPHRHALADRFHRRSQRRFRTGEFLERKARHFHHDIIDGRLERGRSRLRHVVQNFIERIAHRQLRRDLRNREARCLGCQRRTPAHARVHLDHHHAAILGVHRELHVGTARIHADFAQHGDARIAHDLVFFIRQRQRWGDGNAIAGMHAHRVDILDGAHDNAVICLIAHHLHFVFFPAEHALVDHHFADR